MNDLKVKDSNKINVTYFTNFRNKFVYDGKKTEVNVKSDGELDSNIDAHAEVVLPTERVIAFEIKRAFEDKDGVIVIL